MGLHPVILSDSEESVTRCIDAKRHSRQEVDKTLRREDNKFISVKPTSLRDENRCIDAKEHSFSVALISQPFRQNDAKYLTNSLTYSPTHFKKAAFTLAEVLITLGVIGIVAALTIPTLMQKNFEKQRVTQLKKTYSELQQAYVMAVSEYGEPQNWGLEPASTIINDKGETVKNFNGNDKFADIFSKYLKVAKRCKKGQVCFPDLGEDIYGMFNNVPVKTSMLGLQKGDNIVQLVDGTIIGFGDVGDGTCNTNLNDKKIFCADIGVLYPGRQPLTEGIDRFFFALTKEGIIPRGLDKDRGRGFTNNCSHSSASLMNGTGCTAWVIYNENMDYLHCDDLSWIGKIKCK